MHRPISLGLFLLLVASTASAAPADAVLSVDAGPSYAVDGRGGATAEARGGAEVSLSDRVSLGGGIVGSLAAWADVGDQHSGDVLGVSAFAQVHVGIRLAKDVRLEPAAGFGVLHLRGDMLRATLPAYGSSIAVVLGQLRLGVASRVGIGDDDGFAPDTQLTAFFGWQG